MKNLAFEFSAGAKTAIVLDLETQYLSHEVPGGWGALELLKVALVVTWDERHGMRVWYEDSVPALLRELGNFAPIVTFNGEGFDFKVLSPYGPVESLYARSIDILAHLKRRLGFRVKLESVAQATLGRKKTGTGTESVEWWRSGEPALRQKVVDYCKADVELTRDIYLFGKQQGFVFVEDYRQSTKRRVAVSW